METVPAAIVCLTPFVMLRFITRLLSQMGAAGDLIAPPVFAGMFIAAIRNRHRRVAHQRWIMCAALMVATPAPGRAGFIVGVGLLGMAVVPLFATLCALFDRRILGLVHPATKSASSLRSGMRLSL